MKPRVLIFSLAPLSAIGGAEVAVSQLVKRLDNQFEFEVVSANLKSFWSKYFFPWWGYREAVRRQQEKPFALAWAVMANQAGMAAALFKKKFPALPLLLTLQEGDDLESPAYRLRLLGPRLFGVFRRADYIQAISNYLASWARQLGATCAIDVIPNGVDLAHLKAKSYQLKANPTIITTSRLVSKNGVDNLIQALSYLPVNVRLWIVGDGPEAGRLKVLAREFGERVIFQGAIPSAEISNYLAQADIFCRPSRSEGLGNSFLEAMAVGLPTIGTPVGGIPDFLREGETGWLVEVDNPQNLAAKVKYILDLANQETVQKVTANAQKLIRERYDWAKVAQQIGAIFSYLIAKKC